MGKKPADKGGKKELGPAPALSERDWSRWVAFARQHHSNMVALIIQMTGAFALRCGEACQLKTEDFHLDADPPFLDIPGRPGANKSPGKVVMHPHWVREVEALQKSGVATVPRKRENQFRKFTVKDEYTWPEQGYLFLTPRPGRGDVPITYHAVWSAVTKLAPMFDQKYPGNAFARIRTHSGRATAITTMLGQGVSVPIGMKFARHRPGSVGTFLRYGRLTERHVHQTLLNLPGPVGLPLGLASAPASASSAQADDGDGADAQHAAAAAAAAERQVPPAKRAKVSDGAGVVLEGVGLKDLMAWREAGHLSEAEFAAIKAALLKKIAGER